MLTAVKLVDQWGELERRLPGDWQSIRLRLRTEQPDERAEAARILGPMSVGHVEEELTLTVRRAGGAAGPQAARRLFSRLDEARIWCELEPLETVEAVSPQEEVYDTTAGSVAGSWDAALAELPNGWSTLLCFLALDSSAHLDRAALLSAPINPTRADNGVGFTFRCAHDTGYGVSTGMARRCFERLDEEEIHGSVSVLRILSDTDNEATQGTVWYVGNKVL